MPDPNFITSLQQGANDDANSIWRALVENVAALVAVASTSLNDRIASKLPPDAAETLLFTASGLTSVTSLYVANVTGSACDVSVWHVPFDNVPEDKTALYKAVEVAAHTTLKLELNVRLAEGEMIYVQSETGSALAFNLYGS